MKNGAVFLKIIEGTEKDELLKSLQASQDWESFAAPGIMKVSHLERIGVIFLAPRKVIQLMKPSLR